MSFSDANLFQGAVMALAVTCPACSKRYSVDESRGGKKLQCRCGQVFRAAAAPTANSSDPDDQVAILPAANSLGAAPGGLTSAEYPKSDNNQSRPRGFPWVVLGVAMVGGSLALLGIMWLVPNPNDRPPDTSAARPRRIVMGGDVNPFP